MASVISCPSCQKQLKVKDELIGRTVKCPGCQETFTAQVAAAPGPAGEEIVEKPRKQMALPPEEEDEDEAARRPVRRRAADDEGDDRPSRRRRGRPMEPHRGIVVLLLGIGGLVVCAPLSIVAWIMGNKDLKEIDEGRMDPEGRSMTQIGKILGIIGTVLLVVSVVATCGIVGVLMVLGASAPHH
jgi:predicted Zn finger-like uncharacterized protein